MGTAISSIIERLSVQLISALKLAALYTEVVCIMEGSTVDMVLYRSSLCTTWNGLWFRVNALIQSMSASPKLKGQHLHCLASRPALYTASEQDIYAALFGCLKCVHVCNWSVCLLWRNCHSFNVLIWASLDEGFPAILWAPLWPARPHGKH